MVGLGRVAYEVLITEALEARLGRLDANSESVRTYLPASDAADRIALHLAQVIERAIDAVNETDRTATGIALARRLIENILQSPVAADLASEQLVEAGQILRSVNGRLPDGRLESIVEPLIPLLDTTLLTNAPGEPRVGSQ